MSKELNNGIEILVCQTVFKFMDQNSQNIVLINNSIMTELNFKLGCGHILVLW